MSPERSNSSRKRKTATLSLYYSPPCHPFQIIKPSPKLETGYSQLKGDIFVRQRTCKCKLSSCVKMYCWCFASGKYCDGCFCSDCQNNVENEEARQAALESILERNSKSLRKMIMSSPRFSLYNKDGGKENLILVNSIGCCCKRSHCIQGYCECYHTNIFCSGNCKCKNCENQNRCREITSNEPNNCEDKGNFLDSKREDQLNCTLGQSWKIVREATTGPMNFSYRSLLADIIQVQNLTEFCKSLIITSEAVKAGSRNSFNLENLGHEQALENFALMDNHVEGQENQGPGDHSSGIQIDMLCRDVNSVDFIQKERPVSPETVALTCGEKDMLFPPDASCNRMQTSGCYSDVYMEQEKLIFANLRDFLHGLITCGNAKELELSARAGRRDERDTFSRKFVLQSVKRS